MSECLNNPYRVIHVLTRMRFVIILRVHSIVTVQKVIRNSAPGIIIVLFSRFRTLNSNESFANVILENNSRFFSNILYSHRGNCFREIDLSKNLRIIIEFSNQVKYTLYLLSISFNSYLISVNLRYT